MSERFLEVTAKPKNGFRRCGFKFGAKPERIPLEDLTKEQYQMLADDENLVCHVVGEGETKASATGDAKLTKANAEIAKLKDELFKANKASEPMKQELDAANKEVEDLKKSQGAASQEIEGLKKSLGVAEDALGKANAENEKLRKAPKK